MDNKQKQSGVISLFEFYTLEEFKLRLKLTDTAMRALRRKGFKVLRVGKRAFVSGFQEVIFFDQIGGTEHDRQSSQSPFEVPGTSLGMSDFWQNQTEVSQNE